MSPRRRAPPKLTEHQKREAIRRREHGKETLTEIGRSYNVSGWAIARLTLEANTERRNLNGRSEAEAVSHPKIY
jgi:hypothetical protein